MIKRILAFVCTIVATIFISNSMVSAADIYVDWAGGGDHLTITAAINAAFDGDTVHVSAGVYHNDIVAGDWNGDHTVWTYTERIDKSITLLGAQHGNNPLGSTDRGGETILTRDEGLPYSISASGVVMDGFMIGNSNASTGGRIIIGPDADNSLIQNTIIQNTPDGSSGHGIAVYDGATGIIIENNTISNTAWEGIRVDGEATITGNTIKDIPTNKGIYVGPTGIADVSDNSISNTFYEGVMVDGISSITGNTIEGAYKGVNVSATGNATILGNLISDITYEGIQAFGSSTIEGNEITGAYHGLQLRGLDTIYDILDNYIHDNDGHGIEVPNYGGNDVVEQLNIFGNTIENNPWCGVKIDYDEDVSQYFINGNNLVGNGIFGIESKAVSGMVDATSNWWGDASGPSGEGTGSGDAVSRYVDFGSPLGAPVPEPATMLLLGTGLLGLVGLGRKKFFK